MNDDNIEYRDEEFVVMPVVTPITDTIINENGNVTIVPRDNTIIEIVWSDKYKRLVVEVSPKVALD